MANYTHDDNDENFLLNDDSIRQKSQTSHGEIIWTRKASKNIDWNNSNIATFNEASGLVKQTIIEDHGDNLEDSPLLINVSIFNKSISNKYIE